MLITLRYRIKDATTGKHLAAMARQVNRVWNYCGGATEHAKKHNQRWPSQFDLGRLTAGSGKLLGLHSDTVDAVCRQFASSRSKIRKRPRWRGEKSLGWVPFSHGDRCIKVEGAAVVFRKRRYRLWLSRPVIGELRCGSFAADSRGRWYLNLTVEVPDGERPEFPDRDRGRVGVDLGLSHLASLSDGQQIEHPRFFRKYEAQLATAQRARNKKRAKAIHAKIANARRHFLHEETTRLVKRNHLIAVGNVSAKAMTRTKMAKSVLDAGWAMARNMLRYKAIRHGARYVEVDERWTSRTCSSCGSRSGPKGIAGLGMREWVCNACGVVHQRDINSAKLILLGAERCPPVGGILTLAVKEGATVRLHRRTLADLLGCWRRS